LGSSQHAAASKLQQGLGEMDGSNLQARLEHSAQSMRLGLPPDSSLEQSMSADMDRFDQRIHEAQQALRGQQQSPDEALERVERLRSQIDALTRRLGNRDATSSQASQSQNGQFQQSASAQESRGGQQGQGSQQGPGGGQGQQAQSGGQGSQNADSNGGFQPGGPGGPRIWRGGVRGAGGSAAVGDHPYIDSADASSSTEVARQRVLQELNGLRQDIHASAPDAETDVQELMRDLQQLGPGDFPGNPALVEQLRGQVLAAMDKLELRLRRDLGQQESGQIRNGDSLRVPQGYQESVAEYFRRLSEERQPRIARTKQVE
jgi:hypothetical protein